MTRATAFTLRAAVCLLTVALIFPAAQRGQTFSIVHSFSAEHGLPVSNLIQASDGRLYGTAPTGGPPGLGAVYVLAPDGSGGFGFSNLRTFNIDSPEGNQPLAALIQGGDGFFYGTTSAPVQCGGSVFRIDSGGTLTVLHAFSCADGGYATARLLEGGDGFFYGVTSRQGGAGNGTLYRVDGAGNFTVLHSFTAAEGYPASGLASGGDGFFYGTALGGSGIVYRTDATGSLTVVHSFGSGEGSYPSGDLLLGTDGWLYGVTANGGGSQKQGTVFRVKADGTFQQIHAFGTTGARSPLGGLIESAGLFYGTTSQGGSGEQGTVFRMTSDGAVTVLHSFSGMEGSSPTGALLLGSDGVLYGTCAAGGGPVGGTVFGLDPALSLSVIHSFGSLEGNYPQGDLAIGGDGALYGVTQNPGGAWGFGTLFRFDSIEGFSVPHAFTRDEGTGGSTTRLTPNGQDLYGFLSGAAENPEGTFFRSDLSGAITPIHSFSDEGGVPSEASRASDGYFYGANSKYIVRLDGSGGIAFPHTFTDFPFPYPNSAITQASDGFLYGTTRLGGAGQAGTIYRMSLDGDFEELYAFSGPDGEAPERQMRLVEGADGALYGTTSEGGAFGFGTVFRFQPPSTLTTLHDFNLDADGGLPMGSVVVLEDGRVCGATYEGGSGGGGTVFCLGTDGGISVLHAFAYAADPTDGATPWAGLMLGPDGYLYGTTQQGGVDRGGTLFRVQIPGLVGITSIAPGGGPAVGGTAFALTGFQFQDGAAVTVGGESVGGVVVSASTTILATSPALPSGTLNDVVVTNPDNGRATARNAWFVDFQDVPPDDPFHPSIERIFRAGVTAGCGNGSYCPLARVSRAEMAVLLLKSLFGSAYAPRAATGQVFLDVPADAFAAAWIEDLSMRRIAAGCGGGRYCPEASVTRAQMAVFLLKTLLGAAYEPPAATGAVFEDVTADAFAAAWIEDLFQRGVTAGCGGDPARYCPDGDVSRGQMAALLVRTFDLP